MDLVCGKYLISKVDKGDEYAFRDMQVNSFQINCTWKDSFLNKTDVYSNIKDILNRNKTYVIVNFKMCSGMKKMACGLLL